MLYIYAQVLTDLNAKQLEAFMEGFNLYLQGVQTPNMDYSHQYEGNRCARRIVLRLQINNVVNAHDTVPRMTADCDLNLFQSLIDEANNFFTK